MSHTDPDLPVLAPPTTMPDLLVLAEAMQAVAARAADPADPGADGRRPLEKLAVATVESLPAANWASVTMLRGGGFHTQASTSESATRADLLQYEVGSGPCVDAVLDDNVYLTGDITHDPRWRAWGERAHDATGARSVLAYRLTLHDDTDAIACLNIYSTERDAFDEHSMGTGLLLATHGSLLVTAMVARDRAANLIRALASNREIGVAMGILMHKHQLSRDQAFDVLRVASQDSNRKLADVATEVADTGILAINRWPTGSPDRAPAP